MPDQAARFSRGTARRRVHQAAIGRHDHEDRVGPIYQQDGASEQPSLLKGAEKRNGPEFYHGWAVSRLSTSFS